MWETTAPLDKLTHCIASQNMVCAELQHDAVTITLTAADCTSEPTLANRRLNLLYHVTRSSRPPLGGAQAGSAKVAYPSQTGNIAILLIQWSKLTEFVGAVCLVLQLIGAGVVAALRPMSPC